MIKASIAFVAVAAVLVAGTAGAQSCVPSAGAFTGAGGAVFIDTCNSANQLLFACNGLDPIGSSPDTIYSVQVVAGINGNLTATPTGYDLKLALLQESCSAGATCIRDADASGIGGAESFSFTGLPAGSYFLLLTSFDGMPNCGTTMITTFGLPVTLQHFSVD